MGKQRLVSIVSFQDMRVAIDDDITEFDFVEHALVSLTIIDVLVLALDGDLVLLVLLDDLLYAFLEEAVE